jgi:hypothetical protein
MFPHCPPSDVGISLILVLQAMQRPSVANRIENFASKGFINIFVNSSMSLENWKPLARGDGGLPMWVVPLPGGVPIGRKGCRTWGNLGFLGPISTVRGPLEVGHNPNCVSSAIRHFPLGAAIRAGEGRVRGRMQNLARRARQGDHWGRGDHSPEVQYSNNSRRRPRSNIGRLRAAVS